MNFIANTEVTPVELRQIERSLDIDGDLVGNVHPTADVLLLLRLGLFTVAMASTLIMAYQLIG